MNEITIPFLKVLAGGEAIQRSAEVDLSENSVGRPLRVKPRLHRSRVPHRGVCARVFVQGMFLCLQPTSSSYQGEIPNVIGEQEFHISMSPCILNKL